MSDFYFSKSGKEFPVDTSAKGEKLSFVDKERITVQRVSAQDMLEFEGRPFYWDKPIMKMLAPRSHPFAYMDLSRKNIRIAKSEFGRINFLLKRSFRLSPQIPWHLCIATNRINFKPSNTDGYTHLVCTPLTFTGKPAKYPFSLSFVSGNFTGRKSEQGDIYFNQDGVVERATIYCWRKNRGYFYSLKTVDGSLIISQIELSVVSSEYSSRKIIYKA